jgi:hypothetical protein
MRPVRASDASGAAANGGLIFKTRRAGISSPHFFSKLNENTTLMSRADVAVWRFFDLVFRSRLPGGQSFGRAKKLGRSRLCGSGGRGRVNI